ncbi:hypothetical protein [Saccharopolyspora tripterygii]
MELDLALPARALAAVAADLVKLLPGRNPNPVLDGVVLTARADRVRFRNGARRATVITTPESPELHYVLMPRQL